MGTKYIAAVFLFVEYLQYIQNIQGSLDGDGIICPGSQSLVATFCEYSKVVERNDGGMSLDSVELRVPYQEDSCVCHVKVEFNLLPPAIIQIRKHDDQTKKATTIDNCGSIIDIERQYQNGAKDILSPFECQSENAREFSVGDRDTIQLTSRPTNGSLLGGYCLTLHRKHNGVNSTRLTLECFQPKDYSTTDSMITSNNEYLEDLTVNRLPTAESSKIQVSYDKTESLPTSQTEQTSLDLIKQERHKSVVIVVSVFAAVGWTIAIVLLVCVICKRMGREKKRQGTSGNAPTIYEIPCSQRDISNYSNLNQMVQNEQQYEL